MLRLAASNDRPQQPDQSTRLDAIIARAIMTDSAPASFFTDDIPADYQPMEINNARYDSENPDQ